MKKISEQEKKLKELGLLSQDVNEEKEDKERTDAQSEKIESPDKEAEFEKLIKGEFKEQFEERMRNNLKRRFKESSDLKAKNEHNEKIVNMLMEKYAIKDGDTQSLIEAIETDDSYLKDEAEKMGVETDVLKKLRQLEFENDTLKKSIDREKAAKKMEKTISEWISDGEFLKENYPEFDLEADSENPEFINLLKGGAGLKGAYLATHHNEIIKSLVEKAAREAKEEAIEAMRAKEMRPPENGMSSKSAALFKTDVSGLTPEQRAEIAKRVAKGEIISF